MELMNLEVRVKSCKSAVSPSRLPGLDWAVNPYRGCSHACSYCYAQDVTRFETSKEWGEVVEVKSGIVQRLRDELSRSSRRGVYGVGTVTDPYQPLEKEFQLTRGCLEQLKRHDAKVSILTKSDLVLRDLDVLRGWPGVEIGISIGIIDREAARLLEPGAPSPEDRFQALKVLVENDVPAYVMAAPMIPGISDSEESIWKLAEATHDSGVDRIMWDRYNPKPLASSRLRRTLISKGTQLMPPHSVAEARGIRSCFQAACARFHIDLVDAF